MKPWQDALETEALPGCDPNEGYGQHAIPQSEDISLASVWQMDSPDAADRALNGEAYVYRRDGHPNERSLRRRLAKLHGAADALLTAQGMSAIAAIALSFLKPEGRVWIADELYGKSVHLFDRELARWDVTAKLFDPTCEEDLNQLKDAKADLVLIETISNPRLKVPDIRRVAEQTHASGGLLIVDNTFATHLLCQPIAQGADLVVESLGKQVNGHSDAMAGLVAAKEQAVADRIQSVISTFGMASSPLDCYLTQRGLFSLGVRMQRVCENAAAIAKICIEHPQVAYVDYPGLEGHPQHQLAVETLTGGFGWMLSIHLEHDERRTLALMDALKPEIAFAPSLGDVATTISHPNSTSHRGFTEQQRRDLGIGVGTVRVSCGLEPTAWLVERFRAALDALPS